jgi:hypothetical protein
MPHDVYRTLFQSVIILIALRGSAAASVRTPDRVASPFPWAVIKPWQANPWQECKISLTHATPCVEIRRAEVQDMSTSVSGMLTDSRLAHTLFDGYASTPEVIQRQ